MPEVAWVGIIITLAIFVITHIGITIWWASRINTLMDIVQRDLGALIRELQDNRSKFLTKEEATKAIILSEKENIAIWKAIDTLRIR